MADIPTHQNNDDLKKKTDENHEEVIDEPVLDGSEDHSQKNIDPRKGMSDPALIRDIDSEKKSTNPYG